MERTLSKVIAVMSDKHLHDEFFWKKSEDYRNSITNRTSKSTIPGSLLKETKVELFGQIGQQLIMHIHSSITISL